MIEVRLPREGSTTMSAGVVLEWFVAVGDDVEEGQVLVEIETDKVSFEIAAPEGGTVRQRCASAGQEVEVGAVLLRIGDASEPLDDHLDEVEEVVAKDAGESEPELGRSRELEDDGRSPFSIGPEPIRASPAARRLARELGLRIDAVIGTGPKGRITSADVRGHSEDADRPRRQDRQLLSDAAQDALRGLTGHRAVVARRMAQASSETAAVTLMLRADVTRILRAPAASLIDVLAHLAASCVMRHACMNSSLTSEGIVVHPAVGLGYAVDGARGLVVPVVRNAESLPLGEFAAERRRLVRAALDGRLQPSDLSGGTFTISNLGSSGIEYFTPIITPGQSAVLGLGAATPTVVAVDGATAFAVRSLIALSLTFDHRMMDGAEAAGFLGDLKSTLESWRSAA